MEGDEAEPWAQSCPEESPELPIKSPMALVKLTHLPSY